MSILLTSRYAYLYKLAFNDIGTKQRRDPNSINVKALTSIQ